MKRQLAVISTVLGFSLLASVAAAEEGWKAGVGKVVITPKTAMWMAGYGARTKPSEGMVHDLWAKALILEDPLRQRVVLVTLDLCGIGRDFAEPIRAEISKRHKTPHQGIVLACSHTHSGPVVGGNLITMYRLDDAERAKIKAYTELLDDMILEAVDKAAADLAPAEIAWETGKCDFAVNRRANKESDVPALRASLALQGPVDHDVPVLRVTSPQGVLRAIVCGYACHCTVMDGQAFSGDYAGFAQIAIEKANPAATAFFVAGCGADQNPIPRRSLELAETYGKQLAAAVELVIARPMRLIRKPIQTQSAGTSLKFATIPTQAQVENETKSTDFYTSSRAKSLLRLYEANGKLEPTYPYTVQVWRLDDLTWIFLGGEVVVDYSLRLKRNLGANTWVSAYCNDVMAYIPSERVLKEGGYEGGGAMLYYGRPSPWATGVEEEIFKAIGTIVPQPSR